MQTDGIGSPQPVRRVYERQFILLSGRTVLPETVARFQKRSLECFRHRPNHIDVFSKGQKRKNPMWSQRVPTLGRGRPGPEPRSRAGPGGPSAGLCVSTAPGPGTVLHSQPQCAHLWSTRGSSLDGDAEDSGRRHERSAQRGARGTGPQGTLQDRAARRPAGPSALPVSTKPGLPPGPGEQHVLRAHVDPSRVTLHRVSKEPSCAGNNSRV